MRKWICIMLSVMLFVGLFSNSCINLGANEEVAIGDSVQENGFTAKENLRNAAQYLGQLISNNTITINDQLDSTKSFWDYKCQLKVSATYDDKISAIDFNFEEFSNAAYETVKSGIDSEFGEHGYEGANGNLKIAMWLDSALDVIYSLRFTYDESLSLSIFQNSSTFSKYFENVSSSTNQQAVSQIDIDDKTGDNTSLQSAIKDDSETNVKSECEQIKEAGVIKVAVSPDFAPFEYTEGNSIIGIDIEIAKTIAAKLGVELEVKNYSFDNLVSALRFELTDFIVSGITNNIAGNEYLDFSQPYFDASQMIIVKKDGSIKSRGDLNGKVVGVQTGTTADIYLSNEDGSCDIIVREVKRFSAGMDAIMSMINGEVDAVAIDAFPAKKLVQKNQDLVVLLSEGLTQEEYYIAVRKGSDLCEFVNSVLDEMKASGELDRIIESYLEIGGDDNKNGVEVSDSKQSVGNVVQENNAIADEAIGYDNTKDEQAAENQLDKDDSTGTEGAGEKESNVSEPLDNQDSSKLTENELIPKENQECDLDSEAQMVETQDEEVFDIAGKGKVSIRHYLRSGPGYDYELVSALSQNQIVDVYDRECPTGWVYVNADGVDGYAVSYYIQNYEGHSETARQVESFYKEVLLEVGNMNRERKEGDELVKSSRMYLNTRMRLDTLQEWLDEEKPMEELEQISNYLFGRTASSRQELQQWHDNMDSYLLDTLSGRYLDFLMSKLKSLTTVKGTIEPDSIDIDVEDIDSFLNELIVSPEAFGKIWAVTDMYSGKTTFTDDGFSFTWNSTDGYLLDVNAIENVGRVYTDQDTVKQVQEKLNILGYDCGTPDGIAGNMTKNAIKAYRQEHGFSEGEEITQELIYNIDEELLAGNYSDNGNDENTTVNVSSMGDFKTILRNLITIVSNSAVLSIGEPVEQEGMQASYIHYKQSQILFLYGPRNGKTSLGVIPVALNTETNDEYFVFLSYVVHAVDDTLSDYEAFGIVLNTIESGKMVKNGITYEFSQGDPTFYITQ